MIQKLLSPLSPGVACIDPELHENLITAVLNLSFDESNKRAFVEDEKLITFIIDSLKSGTIQTRSNAAAAILSLSALESESPPQILDPIKPHSQVAVGWAPRTPTDPSDFLDPVEVESEICNLRR